MSTKAQRNKAVLNALLSGWPFVFREKIVGKDDNYRRAGDKFRLFYEIRLAVKYLYIEAIVTHKSIDPYEEDWEVVRFEVSVDGVDAHPEWFRVNR